MSIREALRELEMWGAGCTFSLTPYSDSAEKEINIIRDWKELINQVGPIHTMNCAHTIYMRNNTLFTAFSLSCMPQVGDNQCLLQSLKDSPYFAGFADKATLWEGRLADLDEYLHHLNQIQRRWVYLEPIFGHGALPREQARFKRVDADFR